MGMSKVCKWGHSLGVRLPKAVAEAGGIRVGTQVSVRLLDSGCLLVTPLHSKIVVANDHAPKMQTPRVEDW